MARRLVEAGVNLVQVNLGNNETWDTHGNAFPHLKDKLLPPTDQAVSALLDDLHERGLLDSTLIVMAGEFGRTPRISPLPPAYKLPGRDHWGRVQTVFLAGGGVVGGRVDRLVRQDRRLPGVRPADAREPGRDDLPGARHPAPRRLARRARPAPPRLSRRADPRACVICPTFVHRQLALIGAVCVDGQVDHLASRPARIPRESIRDTLMNGRLRSSWGPSRLHFPDCRPDASPITVMIYRIHRTGRCHLNKLMRPAVRVKFAFAF